jgi:ring-1,2-phenylacetyl-CoA epoxidase subunit PaaB
MLAETQIYEVLIQETKEKFPVNVGSVRAPNSVLALHMAREIYARREQCVRLMVINRNNIHSLDDETYLGYARQRVYRMPFLRAARK